MQKNEELEIVIELIPNEPEEIVSDLLYTLFQTIDEYLTRKNRDGNNDEELIQMNNYINQEMRKYAKTLYQVEIEE